MDVFVEQLVKHKKTGVSYILAGLIVFLAAVLFLFFALVSFSGILGTFTGVGYLLMVGVIYFAFYGIKYLNIEYEYILTNSELDVDRILGKVKRKRVLSIDFKEITACAKLDTYTEAYGEVAKTFDFTGPGMFDTYFIVTELDGYGRVLILFEPTAKLIEAASKFSRKIVL